ncbi:hypothetical protein D3C81_1988430 [compost metagenome]
MAAPAPPRGIEALLETVGQAPEGHQRMPALGFAQQRIERYPGDTQQRHTHGFTPQWFSYSKSDNGRGSAQPCRANMGAG